MAEKKACPLRLTRSGRSSNLIITHLSICRQCELLGLNRSTYYLPPAIESEENLRLMRLIDQQYLKTPFYGSRRMAACSGAVRGGGQPQAGPAADGADGPGGAAPQAADDRRGDRTRGPTPTCSATGC